MLKRKMTVSLLIFLLLFFGAWLLNDKDLPPSNNEPEFQRNENVDNPFQPIPLSTNQEDFEEEINIDDSLFERRALFGPREYVKFRWFLEE